MRDIIFDKFPFPHLSSPIMHTAQQTEDFILCLKLFFVLGWLGLAWISDEIDRVILALAVR